MAESLLTALPSGNPVRGCTDDTFVVVRCPIGIPQKMIPPEIAGSFVEASKLGVGEDPSSPGRPPLRSPATTMCVDEILDKMEFTWIHYFAIFSMITTNIVSAFNNLMTSLLTSNVEHECRLMYPNETAVDSCEVFINGTDSNATVPCQHGYRYTYTLEGATNIRTQWDLVCDEEYTSFNITTIYFSGVALSGIVFGIASDRFGRKKVTLLCLVGTLSMAWSTCFVNNLTAYTVLYWFEGFFTQGMEMSNYCLLMEIVPSKRRSFFAAIMECNWGIGTIVTGLIGYLIRDWRWINFTGNAPLVVIGIIHLCFIPESIRWLINNGKMKEAEKHFHSYIARTTPEFRGVKLADIISSEDLVLAEKTKYNITHLFRTRNMRLYTLGLTYIMFAITLNYWGIIYGSTEIGEHPYINTLIGGAFEFIPYLASNYVLTRLGRRMPMLFYLLVTSVTVFIAGWLPRDILNGWIPGGVLLLGRMANTGCWTIMNVYSSELFPTNIRNLGMNHAGFWVRIAEMVSPQMMRLSDVYYPLNYILFGFSTFVAMAVIFFMPETKDKELPDTIEEAESLGRKVAASGT